MADIECIYHTRLERFAHVTDFVPPTLRMTLIWIFDLSLQNQNFVRLIATINREAYIYRWDKLSKLA